MPMAASAKQLQSNPVVTPLQDRGGDQAFRRDRLRDAGGRARPGRGGVEAQITGHSW